MFRSLRDLLNYALFAGGMNCGKISEFIIDDFNWVVRYLVVNTGSRSVIVSVRSVHEINPVAQTIEASLEPALLQKSLEYIPGQEVSREQEILLSEHYGWGRYWEEEALPNTMPGDLTAIPLVEMELNKENLVPVTGGEPNPLEVENHLRHLTDLIGYSVQARNGSAGKLCDLIVQEENCDIPYLVIESGRILGGKKVLVSPQWVQTLQWGQSNLQIDLNRETIQNSPEFHPEDLLDEGFWSQVNEHYSAP